MSRSRSSTAPGRAGCSACTRACRSPAAPPSTPGSCPTGPGRICHDSRVKSPFEFRVRPARMADQAALAELDALAWSADSGFPSTMPTGTPDVTFFSASNPPEAHLVAELDGRVVGYIRLKPPTHLPENGHVMQVQGLAVRPDAR